MNANTTPKTKPQLTREELLKQIAAAHPDFKLPDFLMVGIRGYYLNTMGEKGKNDRKIYDDAFFLLSKTDFAAFNANVDPSGQKLSLASLKPGIWPVYKFDKHRGTTTQAYDAICQRAGDVVVVRDGDEKTPVVEEKGSFGINIHAGGNFSTSSLGCTTITPSQWKAFYAKAVEIAEAVHGKDFKTKTYTYLLLENKPAKK